MQHDSNAACGYCAQLHIAPANCPFYNGVLGGVDAAAENDALKAENADVHRDNGRLREENDTLRRNAASMDRQSQNRSRPNKGPGKGGSGGLARLLKLR